ncbi:TlpA family protein disulfide reductase [Dyadobacter luteus]|uniref:TlpA family protein disulfide reductase n=1 Tax=Dyadobacter luteus TaxID=2259619 RepID=UPI0013149D4E|nr:TlpA disulfide reductase family protein [Dyadobacter luteus]
MNHSDSTRLIVSVVKNDSVSIFRRDIYIEPGKSVSLHFSDGKLTFGGDLGLINSYLQDSDQITKVIRKQHSENFEKFISLSEQDADLYLTRVTKPYNELNVKIQQDSHLSTYHKELLLHSNYLFATSERKNFNFYRQLRNISKAEKRWTREGTKENFYSPDYFSNFSVNPYFLKINPITYSHYIGLDFNVQLTAPIDHHISLTDKNWDSKYEVIKEAILAKTDITQYHEFILAMHNCTYLATEYNFEKADAIVNSFKSAYPTSDYLTDLEYLLSEISVTKAGQLPPQVAVNDIEGKEFTLADLKGKLVYLDFWATWCGPCIEELKYSKKLSKKYADNPDIVFMYISKDGDVEKWKRYLAKHPDLKGMHGIDKQSQNSLSSGFRVDGIPHYALIEKDGKIINSYADRPSVLLNNDVLDKLLK